MASLEAVIDQLKINEDAQYQTTGQLLRLNSRIDSLVESMNLQRLDMLEALREKKNITQPAAAASGAPQSKDSGGGFSFMGLGALGALGATLAAVAASVTGLDDFFKAVRVVDVLNKIRKVVGNVIKVVVRVGNSLTDLVKATGTFADEILKGVKSLRTFKAPFPDIPVEVTNFFKSIQNRVIIFLDDLKLKVFTTIPDDIARVSQAASDFFQPIRNFFTRIGDVLKPIFQVAEGAGKGIMATVNGAGTALKSVTGFLGTLINTLEPVLSPIKKLAGLALRPFFQLMISAIDFVIGFYDGFTETAGGLKEKLLGGLQGGIKGVIKGITKAIDLIFIELPAFISKKLGFEEFSKTLKEFNLTQLVDPAFEAVKNFFREGFSSDLFIPPGLKDSFANMGADFFARTLSAILPPPDFFRVTTPKFSIPGLGTLGGGTYDFNPFPASLYEFAGIDFATGEKMQRPTDPAVQQAQAVESMIAAGSAQRGAPFLVDDNSAIDKLSPVPNRTSDILADDARAARRDNGNVNINAPQTDSSTTINAPSTTALSMPVTPPSTRDSYQQGVELR